MSDTTRRTFLANTAAATAAAALPTAVHAAGNDVIKVGVIGCGGRGSGAASDILKADKSLGGKTVEIIACADFFPDRAKRLAKNLSDAGFKDKVKVGDRAFGGLDGYKKVLEAGPDLVILATTPGFRPAHLEAAINAGKHVFCEKPVAVDGPGIRKCLELVDESKKKGLAVVAGTQRRHQQGYIDTVKKLQDGAIGKPVAARCSWNDKGIWFHPRKTGASDLAYQIDNWYHFLWLCGDHIVEQHVHNLDVINWVLGAHPVKASGFGGRGYAARKPGDPNEVGNIYDHFTVEYEYPGGVLLTSTCTHIPGIKSDVSETVLGTKGTCRVNAYTINRERVAKDTDVSPYVQEHIDLLQSIKAGKPLNELKQVTESTMTAILGRMAAYSGQEVKWEQALNSKESTMPENLSADSTIAIGPVPIPGKYKVA
ncbi:MAG: Gfo/Idh/MocA family oxidoreductase [Gemmataceae bacterium]